MTVAPPAAAAAAARAGWSARLRALAPGRSIKRRLVLLFLLLAVLLTALFAGGAQRAFRIGWQEAARPLLADYVDRLAAEITAPDGATPRIAAAQALAARLPVTVRITGPVVNWASHPAQADHDDARAGGPPHEVGDEGASLLERHTADGHRIRFAMDRAAVERRTRLFVPALAALLAITFGAYLAVRRLLRPLDEIAAGAQRFGAGDFGQPIPVRHPAHPDELGRLAATVNTMGTDIARMLDGQRALLLAISHELRSPLTRARLHAELLPEDGEAGAQRSALLRDLQEMATLVADLLESERLAGRHAALQRAPTDLPALARTVIAELQHRHPGAAAVTLQAAPGLPPAEVDAARVRLLLRNLLDNALRHGAGAPVPPVLSIRPGAPGAPAALAIEVRDHGPGVPEDQLARLAEAFYRPDSARTRSTGGVGLGLYLCRLVAEAHGGRLDVAHAHPGLRVRAVLPLQAGPGPARAA